MFDIGWSELVVIAIVAVLVVGPRELPGMLRTIGKSIGNIRRMASDFQRQFDQALKEAELDEVRKEIKAPFQPLEDARKSAEAFQKQVSASVAELEAETSFDDEPAPTVPASQAAPASAETKPAPATAPVAAPAPSSPTPATQAQPAAPAPAAAPANTTPAKENASVEPAAGTRATGTQG